jgi:hypothetical protein
MLILYRQVRNFLPVNNFATWSLVLQTFLLPCFFSLEPSLISFHSYPSWWIWVKWYWTWFQEEEKKREGRKNLCSRRDQVAKLLIARDEYGSFIFLVYFTFWLAAGGLPAVNSVLFVFVTLLFCCTVFFALYLCCVHFEYIDIYIYIIIL